MTTKRMFKVLSPREKDGHTFWNRLGTGYTNKDGSINVYLDSLPIDGKLQIREMTEEDFRPKHRAADASSPAQLGLAAHPPAEISADQPPF